MKLGIRQKLLLVFTTIALVGGITQFLNAGYQLELAVLGFYQRDLLAQTLQVSSTFPESLEHYLEGETGIAELQGALERARGTDTTLDFTLLNTDRTVIASTASPRNPLFSQLPLTGEIAAALNGHATFENRPRFSGESAVFVAAPIYYEDNLLGLLQASAPLAPAFAEAARNWLSLASIAIPILLLTVAASIWVGRSIANPIRRLNQSALRIAHGEFEERVPVHAPDEIGQLAQSFNQMAEQVNKLISAQRSFVSNAAHELRSPLASAQLRLEAVQTEVLSAEQQRRYLAEASEGINQMSGLITQLLALARLDEGRLVRASPLLDEPTTFLLDLSRRWRIQAHQAGLAFESNVPSALGPIQVDPDDLQIVLDNLFSNAVKYTPRQGFVWFAVNDQVDNLVLRMRDSGEGFTPEDGQRLFERFFRVDRTRNTQVPGTGLGLSIAEAIIEHYGGTISASSDGPGKGATFQIVLPIR